MTTKMVPALALISLMACGSGKDTDTGVLPTDDRRRATSPSDAAGDSRTSGETGADSGTSEPDARTDASRTASALGVATCVEAGCETGFHCSACDAATVCDDLDGPAKCVTVEAFVECGEGTVFCNSSCGVCQLPGERCDLQTCSNVVEACGSGASCGRGTVCSDDICVLR